ncbi:hypothetical protein DTW90_31485 [Neorhizobium sp. P12A]|uniref:hypothetical protein n=1 Tax=Rhizobium/Agrobacterium group TaxID=227290 RepID=UPI00104E3F91|nr:MULTISPECIES: hypothetical protein [Rhizobium/Agrobacterium group]KAA0689429.1 hypothetical protein DTW90_31485 [Neorhizobium sp. P12A]TCR74040.1 hypothetical protein EV561_1248 [Rhizobium sp. BK376]
MKLTKSEVYQRLEAALAILGEEDSEDAEADMRLSTVRILLKHAIEEPAGEFDNVAHDITDN